MAQQIDINIGNLHQYKYQLGPFLLTIHSNDGISGLIMGYQKALTIKDTI